MTRVFLAYSFDRDREFIAALRDAIKSNDDLSVFDPAESPVGVEIASEIRSQIETCDVFVSVVGLDRPNILLETGMALGAGKSLLLVASSLDPLPLNLRALPVVLMSGDPAADASKVVHRLLEFRPSSPTPDIAPMSTLEKLAVYRRDPRLFDSIPPRAFEDLVAKLFEEQGFEVTLTGRTHDAGFDVLVRSPADDRLIAVEVKKYSRQSRVSIAHVRQLLGAALLTNADVAVLVTSSTFTSGAQALASEVSKPQLELVTMDRLLETDRISDLWDRAANKAS